MNRFGFVDEELLEIRVRKYAAAKAAHKRAAIVGDPATVRTPDDELAYQEEVLERMKSTGCKGCAEAAQARHVARLRAELAKE